MKKKRWLGMLVLVCLMALNGCGSKEKSSGQEKKAEHTENGSSTKSTQKTEISEATGMSAKEDSSKAHEEDTEVLPESGDAEQEKLLRGDIAAQLPFTAGDDKVCAIVYLGKEARKQEKALKDFFAKYVPEYTPEQIAALPRVDNQGEEAYLIVPRYEACEVSVNRLEKQEDGTVSVVLDAEKPQGAFILYCNPSQEFSNAEVNIAYRAKVHVIMPKISPLDNRLEPMQVALDLTQETAYQ